MSEALSSLKDMRPDEKRRLLTFLFDDPTIYPEELKSWLQEYLGVFPPQFVPSEVSGLIQVKFGPVAAVSAAQTTSSTAYTDLSTTGPGLTSMRAGRYLLIYSFFGNSSATASGNEVFMAPAINGTVSSDNAEAAIQRSTAPSTVTKVYIKTLDRPSNQVQMKYKVSGGTGTYAHRQLIAARIGEA